MKLPRRLQPAMSLCGGIRIPKESHFLRPEVASCVEISCENTKTILDLILWQTPLFISHTRPKMGLGVNRFLIAIACFALIGLNLVVCGWPPLHKAAYEGDLATAKDLTSSGALLNQKDFKSVLNIEEWYFIFIVMLGQ